MARGDLLWTNCHSPNYLSRTFGSRANTRSHEASSIRIHHEASLMRIYPFKASRNKFFGSSSKNWLNPYCLLYFSLKFFYRTKNFGTHYRTTQCLHDPIRYAQPSRSWALARGSRQIKRVKVCCLLQNVHASTFTEFFYLKPWLP